MIPPQCVYQKIEVSTPVYGWFSWKLPALEWKFSHAAKRRRGVCFVGRNSNTLKRLAWKNAI